MTPLPVDPRADVTLADVMRGLSDDRAHPMTALLLAGKRPTLIVCDRLYKEKR